MKIIVVAVAVFMLGSAFSNVFAQEMTVLDLWFPGGLGSYWIYDVPSIGQVKITTVEDFGRYRAVEEDHYFLDKLIGYEFLDHSPFLTFKQRWNSRLVGYGTEVNENFRWLITSTFWDWSEMKLSENIKMKLPDDEWILLDGFSEGDKWTVSELRVTMMLDEFPLVCGIHTIEGEIEFPQLQIQTPVGEFEALTVVYWVTENINLDREKELLCAMYLVPGVGLVRLETEGEQSQLIEYHLTPFVWPKPVANPGKLCTTWARLKENR